MNYESESCSLYTVGEKNQIISPSQLSFFVMHFLVFAILTGSGPTGALLLVFICSVLCSSICNLDMFR